MKHQYDIKRYANDNVDEVKNRETEKVVTVLFTVALRQSLGMGLWGNVDVFLFLIHVESSLICYSVLSAVTGSFLAALEEGNRPATVVNNTATKMMMAAI